MGSGTSKTGLTSEGIDLARQTGRKLDKGVKVKGYYSGVPRSKASLEYELGAFRAKGGKTYPQIRERGELKSFNFVKDMASLDRMIEQAANEDQVLRRWLDGKLSTAIIEKPKVVADKVIRKRFGLGQRVARMGGKDRLLENVAHSWLIEAVFERLTGKKFEEMQPGTMVREMEPLVMTHYKNGKTVLRYRGKSFDVTKRFNQILKEN